jgi:arylsulfatase A-like enzyme
MAAQGVRFETAISPAPLTLPSHASLMTGLDPPRHGVRHNSIHRLAAGVPTLAEHMRAHGMATAAFVGALVLDRRFGLDRGFDVYDDRMERRSARFSGYAERPADHVVDAAVAWLERAPQRFFLWVHLYDPHVEHQPPPGFAAAFARRPYLGEIAFADQQTGRLVRAVRDRFGDEGLLVAITSDHGESLGEHGEPTHAYTVYDATQRVPLILLGTGLPAGRVVATPVRLLDVAPTLLATVGARALDSDGRDLRPLWEAPDAGGDPPAAYVETLATHLDYGWSPLVGLRTERFKYIRAPRPELYDLAADPGELHDLADRDPERVRRLDAALERRLASPSSTGASSSATCGPS